MIAQEKGVAIPGSGGLRKIRVIGELENDG